MSLPPARFFLQPCKFHGVLSEELILGPGSCKLRHGPRPSPESRRSGWDYQNMEFPSGRTHRLHLAGGISVKMAQLQGVPATLRLRGRLLGAECDFSSPADQVNTNQKRLHPYFGTWKEVGSSWASGFRCLHTPSSSRGLWLSEEQGGESRKAFWALVRALGVWT